MTTQSNFFLCFNCTEITEGIKINGEEVKLGKNKILLPDDFSIEDADMNLPLKFFGCFSGTIEDFEIIKEVIK